MTFSGNISVRKVEYGGCNEIHILNRTNTIFIKLFSNLDQENMASFLAPLVLAPFPDKIQLNGIFLKKTNSHNINKT